MFNKLATLPACELFLVRASFNALSNFDQNVQYLIHFVEWVLFKVFVDKTFPCGDELFLRHPE